jgi:hypothetical protein
MALLFTCGGIGLVSAQESPPKIVFLHLKLESNQVSLVSSSVAPGRLKRFPEQRPALDLEVATAAGQVLWTNNVADPSIRHLEYEDPDHPGQIIGKEVQTTNRDFTVRIPALRDANQVNFYLPPSPVGTNEVTANSSTTNASPPRKLVGSVVLPPEAK